MPRSPWIELDDSKRYWLKIFAVATGVALFARVFLFETFRISSTSMAPTLFNGDLALATKFSYGLHVPFSAYEFFRVRAPRRGEIVAFTLPDRTWVTYVKRVIATQGDTVEVRNGVLLVNGIPSTYKSSESESEAGLTGVEWETQSEVPPYPVLREGSKTKDYGPVEVPANHFFALGDNRGDSLDSRTWGPVPYSCLSGKVSFVWLSVADRGELRGRRMLRLIN